MSSSVYRFVWKWWWKTTKSSGSTIIYPILAMNGGSAQFWTPCASRPCLCDCTHSGTCCWQAGAWNLSAPHHRHIELESRQEVCSNPANWNWSCRRWWCCQQRLRTWSQERTGTRTSCHPYHHQRSVHMKVWKALHVHRSTRSKRCANPPQTDGQQSDACSTECLAKPLARSLAVPHPHCTSCGSQQEIHCRWLVVLPGIGCCQVCLPAFQELGCVLDFHRPNVWEVLTLRPVFWGTPVPPVSASFGTGFILGPKKLHEFIAVSPPIWSKNVQEWTKHQVPALSSHIKILWLIYSYLVISFARQASHRNVPQFLHQDHLPSGNLT